MTDNKTSLLKLKLQKMNKKKYSYRTDKV